MSLLFRVVFATACKSTHHKLALDALRHLRGERAEAWRKLFLKHYEAYLTGAKDPDAKFKDFKNHVLHVGDGFWGGAVAATAKWYDTTAAALREGHWADAVYAAGVMSHYYSDPLMPFHTGQTEEEGKVHRAAEWSIACGYGELQNIIERDLGYPQFEIPPGPEWLATMVRAGALTAHPHYHVLIDHYDLPRGVQDPPSGMDQEFKDRIAACLAHATIGIARLLERAIQEAAVTPPDVSLSVETFLATLKVPIRWVIQKLADARERAQIEALFAEIRAKGKVLENLPEDDKLIRALHAEEVLKTPLADLDAQPARPSGQAFGDGAAPRARSGRANLAAVRPRAASAVSRDRSKLAAPRVVEIPAEAAPTPPPKTRKPKSTKPRTPRSPAPRPEPGPRFYLHADRPLRDAPTIGPASARRFDTLGIRTVGDFFAMNPDDVARQLDDPKLSAAVLRDIQAQARLVCDVPNLRGHDAQVLVACGIVDAAALASSTPEEMLARLAPFLATPAADRILRGNPKPDAHEVAGWIENARSARPPLAA